MDQPEPTGQRSRLLPAWPLGCALALLSLLLMVNLAGLLGMLAAAGGGPAWLVIGVPLAVSLAVPFAQLIGWALVRRRNRYAARVLLWGFGLTLALGAAITVALNLVDYFALRS